MSMILPFEGDSEPERRYLRVELGRREPQDVPFGSLLSYGPNGSPTITVTKTLFSAVAVTSTKSGVLVSSGLMNAADAAAVTSSLDYVSTCTTTHTVTNFHTWTITTTTAVSPTSSLVASPSTATSNSSNSSHSRIPMNMSKYSNFLSNLGSHTSTTSHPSSTAPSSASTSGTGAPPGTVAGATLGSMAALSFLGIFLWVCCWKRKEKGTKLRANFALGRRKSSPPPTTPWLENQSIEETRAIMLQSSLQAKEKVHPSISEMPDTPVNRDTTATERAAPYQPWIGLAVSSSTPPHTPPFPHSQSSMGWKESHAVRVQEATPYHPSPAPSTSDLGITSQSQLTPSTLLTLPKPVMRKPVASPAPIITSQRLVKHEAMSPLSPRGLFNALGDNTKGAWKRASQILSPRSRYSIAKKEGQGGFEFLDKEGSLKRDESEPQGSKNDSDDTVGRKGTVFGRRSQSSTRVDNKGWTGQWI